MSKLIVILGITGEQGGSVAALFSTLPEWRVRGVTRNVNSKSSLCLAEKEIDLIKGDLNDSSTLVAAFTGATAIFATTNFWDPFYNPATQSLLKEGQTVNEYCYDQELQQVKNIADAASQTEGLERLVISTLCDSSKWSYGKYRWVYHFDSKARGVEYIRGTYPELTAKMSTIHMAPYMSNWKQGLHFRKTQEGKINLTILKGTQHGLRPQIDNVRDTGVLVHGAIQVPAGKNILGSAVSLTWTDQLQTWCEILGLEYGGFDEVSLEQFESFIPIPGLGKEIGEMMLFIDEFGNAGGEHVLLPQDLGVELSPLTSWEEYVKGEDWTTVLASLK